MKAALLRPVMFLAFIGLTASLVVHILAWLSVSIGSVQWVLHGGIFVVFLPCVLLMQQMTKAVPQKDIWKAALRGCPQGMVYATYGFFGYAFINFFVVFVLAGGPDSQGSAQIARGFSGHWMAFYSVSFAVLYSALHVDRLDGSQTCVNGHTASPFASFCPECGATLHSNVAPL
jgi:hypothetical protein